MRKKLLILLFITISIIYINAEVAENFEAGGFAISGSMGANFYFDYVPEINDVDNFSYYLNFNPTFQIFLVRNLAFSISHSVSFNHQIYYYSRFLELDDTITYEKDLSEYYYLSFQVMRIGIDYFFHSIKLNNKVVPYIGSDVGLRLTPSIGSYYDEEFIEDKSVSVGFSLNNDIGVYFFVRDRIAVRITNSFNLNFDVELMDEEGNEIEDKKIDEITLSTGVSIGFTYFIPRKDRSLIKVEKNNE